MIDDYWRRRNNRRRKRQMTSEVAIVIQGHEHVLRGHRAVRFNSIMARKYKERPELMHAGRIERRAAEEAAFRETMEGK
jgi:hypothetical protein